MKQQEKKSCVKYGELSIAIGIILFFTHVGIEVSFYEDMFDHCFFESAAWKEKDKSILSLNRFEKRLWIKATLGDASALMKQGWDKKKKSM